MYVTDCIPVQYINFSVIFRLYYLVFGVDILLEFHFLLFFIHILTNFKTVLASLTFSFKMADKDVQK